MQHFFHSIYYLLKTPRYVLIAVGVIIHRSINTAIRIFTLTSSNTAVYGPLMRRKVTVNYLIRTVSFDLGNDAITEPNQIEIITRKKRKYDTYDVFKLHRIFKENDN
jgi:hypothetical protein